MMAAEGVCWLTPLPYQNPPVRGAALPLQQPVPVKRLMLPLLLTLIAGCITTPSPRAKASPPWREPRLARAVVPAVYVREWSRAENRDRCALLAPRSLGGVTAATPRSANFSGGWAVAYDTADVRSAFGIAGTAAEPRGTTYSKWPFARDWDDGSSVGYGPEGGTGPNQLAYLRIDGQDCLYNVWSRLGQKHLEELIAELRFVEPAP